MSYATADQVAGLPTSGHGLFSRISRLPFPMVALIDGACMGGGTELALVMDERLVSNAPHTQIGLPEVSLGLLPGWGGTQRLPRLIGLNAAIEMVCSSEIIPAQKAVALGFAFDIVPPESLVEEGRRHIEYLHAARPVEGAASGARAAPASPRMHFILPLPSPRARSRARPRGSTRPPWSPSRRFATAQPAAGRRAEGRAKGLSRAARLADHGQSDRHLLHEEPPVVIRA